MLKRLEALALANPQITGVVILGIGLLVFFIWLFSSSTSKNEQKADEARSNSEIHQVNTAISNAQVETAGSEVESAEKTSQKALE